MSASTDYATVVTRDQYIARACKLVGLIADGGNAVISADMLADGKAMLADLNAAWHNEGINLNVNRETTFPMPAASVRLGPDGESYTCINPHVAEAGSVVELTPGGTQYACLESHTASATSRPTTGTDWTTYWSVYALGGSPVTTWISGVAYTGAPSRPATGAYWLDYWKKTGTATIAWAIGATYDAPHVFNLPVGLMYVKDAYLRDSSGYDYPLSIVPETEYLGIADKFTSGKPALLQVVERPWNAKTVRMFPAFPDRTDYMLHVNGVYYMGDFTNPSTELDAPVTARLAMLFDLASLMADLYQRPQMAQQFASRAVAYKRNFFRTYQESENVPRQVSPRFPKSRWCR
jgi:hypothetical protein